MNVRIGNDDAYTKKKENIWGVITTSAICLAYNI